VKLPRFTPLGPATVRVNRPETSLPRATPSVPISIQRAAGHHQLLRRLLLLLPTTDPSPLTAAPRLPAPRSDCGWNTESASKTAASPRGADSEGRSMACQRGWHVSEGAPYLLTASSSRQEGGPTVSATYVRAASR
jgi:hypothetical protein